MLGTNGWLIVSGAAVMALAAWVLWRTSQYDLKGAVIDSAIQVARGKRLRGERTAIEDKLAAITAEATMTGKAKRAAGTVLGHFAAQILGVGAWVMLAVGAVMVAAGVVWR